MGYVSARGGVRHALPLPVGVGWRRPAPWPKSWESSKSAVSRRIDQLRGTPAGCVWERGYYERVVRRQGELDKFRKYIMENTLKWEKDRENPENIKGKMRG